MQLGEHFFPPTTNLGFLGRSLVFRSKPFLKSSGTEEGRLGIWEGGSWSLIPRKVCVWGSGAKEHDHAEHHEDIPQGDEDPEVSEAQ